MKNCARFGLTLLLLAPLQPAFAATEIVGDGTDQSPYEIPEISSEVRVDGVLDDPAWQHALTLELGYETSPGENVEPRARTEVLLASSATNLYVAFRAYDPDPSEIVANITDRDNMFDDDRLSFILDTFNDHHRGYMFFVNPYGIQGDALDAYGMGGGDPAWDTIWESEGHITEDGYVVECAVPFSSLRFPRTEGPQVWGIGFGRKYSRDFDYRMALMPRDRDETCYLCQVAKFRGFAQANPGRNIELDPTVSSVRTQNRRDFPHGDFERPHTDTEAGLTARWGVTPNLVLSGTANPDFSQVEADAFQLEANTRFALYYEEKRPFFLEGMEHFQMRLNPVYTRTVADPSWGLKLTGEEGSNALGAFVARDEVTNLVVPGSQGSWSTQLASSVTDAALRYRMDLASASTAGLVVTAREGDEYENLVGGVDGDLRLTPSDRLGIQVLASRTNYPDTDTFDNQPAGDFDGWAYDAEFDHDSANLEWWVAYRQIDGGFRADLGYRPQADFRQTRGGWTYSWRAEAGHWYTVVSSGFGYVHEEEVSGELLSSFFDYWVNYSGPLRSWVGIYGTVGTDRYAGVDYDKARASVETGFWPGGSTMLSVDTSFGKDIDYENERSASSVNVEGTALFKLAKRVDAAVAHEFEQMQVDEGRLYTANISYLRTAYQFTRRAFLRAILQYVEYDYASALYQEEHDPRYRHFASQILFSYKANAQTVFYVGYSDNHLGDGSENLAQRDRTFFMKVGYALVL